MGVEKKCIVYFSFIKIKIVFTPNKCYYEVERNSWCCGIKRKKLLSHYFILCHFGSMWVTWLPFDSNINSNVGPFNLNSNISIIYLQNLRFFFSFFLSIATVLVFTIFVLSSFEYIVVTILLLVVIL